MTLEICDMAAVGRRKVRGISSLFERGKTEPNAEFASGIPHRIRLGQPIQRRAQRVKR